MGALKGPFKRKCIEYFLSHFMHLPHIFAMLNKNLEQILFLHKIQKQMLSKCFFHQWHKILKKLFFNKIVCICKSFFYCIPTISLIFSVVKKITHFYYCWFYLSSVFIRFARSFKIKGKLLPYILLTVLSCCMKMCTCWSKCSFCTWHLDDMEKHMLSKHLLEEKRNS